MDIYIHRLTVAVRTALFASSKGDDDQGGDGDGGDDSDEHADDERDV